MKKDYTPCRFANGLFCRRCGMLAAPGAQQMRVFVDSCLVRSSRVVSRYLLVSCHLPRLCSCLSPRGMQTLPRRESTGNPTPSSASLGLHAPPGIQGCGSISGRNSISSGDPLGGGGAALVPRLSGDRTFSADFYCCCYILMRQRLIRASCSWPPRTICCQSYISACQVVNETAFVENVK